MNRDDSFEHYFHLRAAVADELASRGLLVEATLVATTALDALGEIWLHDFPADRRALDRAAGGKVSASIRMARLVEKFAPADSKANKIAVVCFAEDWKRLAPNGSTAAEALLAPPAREAP